MVMLKSKEELASLLRSIDHRGYPAYKSLRGEWSFPGYVLGIDHVQGDPFAAPSSLSLHVPGKTAGIPADYYAENWRRTALEDHLIRLFGARLRQYSFQAGGSGKSGLLSTSQPGQEVLERSACRVDPKDGSITMRFEAGFPAAGRTVLAGALHKMLFEYVPKCFEQALVYANIHQGRMRAAIEAADDHKALRDYIRENGYVAFVADGSILPRQSGVSEEPLEGAVRFKSPESLRVSIHVPHAGKITGMALGQGITVIAGGGYHGKSTLLRALERGVYNHVAGDGREYVVTDPTAVKVRAEDGRSIADTDISFFINHLPGGDDTRHFHTENASGSTSQAACVVEAIEAGSRLLLIDEDTSATNFMIRDALMLSVISRDMEPITPLLERAESLKKHGISMILAVGSSGSWFYPADRIIQMDKWLPYDITQAAKTAAKEYDISIQEQEEAPLPQSSRIPVPRKGSGSRTGNRRGGGFGREVRGRDGRDSREKQGQTREERVKIRVQGREAFSLNRDEVSLRCVEQIVDSEQTAALARCLSYASARLMDGKQTITEIADALETMLDKSGLEVLSSGTPSCGLARPRRQEILAAINRWRGLQIR